MIPLFFGSASRRLFGIYEPGRAPIQPPEGGGKGGGRPRAAVLCHPWGQEYIRAHRSMRRLAVMLAASGRDTLSFDYFGTGDSAGDTVDGDLAGWESDIAAAIDEVMDVSGTPRIALIGLRLGASLAARVASKRPKSIEALVLWDPVISGQNFLQELHAMETSITSAAPVERPAESGGGHEILGFSLTAALAAQIETLDLLAVVPGLPPRTLTLFSRPSPACDVLASAPMAVECMSCAPAWLEDRYTGAGAIPAKTLQRIVQWLA
jgi:uncharacterized protein